MLAPKKCVLISSVLLLSSLPPSNWAGEGGWLPSRPIGLVFLLCVALARPALAGGVDVRSSIQGPPWNGTSFDAKRQRDYTAANKATGKRR